MKLLTPPFAVLPLVMIMFEKLFQLKLKLIKKRRERQKARYELEKEYLEFTKHKKHKVSNIMLVIIVIAILSYTIANFWLAYTTGVYMDSTLTTCFYAFWSSEIVALATLKTSKIVKGIGYKKDDNDDDDEFIGG